MSEGKTGLLHEKEFWEQEGDAPILNANRGFFEPNKEWVGQDEVVKGWFQSLGITAESLEKLKDEFEVYTVSQREVEPLRIYIKDAERTFRTEEHQKDLIEILSFIESQTGGYHQGIALIGGFLRLAISQFEVVAVLMQFAQRDTHLKGVWKAEAVSMATDAYVFQELLQQHLPHVCEKFAMVGVMPEMYCQKYWCALSVHVLSFEALTHFLSRFAQQGYVFLFQVLMNLVNEIEPQIMAAKDTAQVLQLLRLDREKWPDLVTNELCMKIVDAQHDRDYQLPSLNFAELRLTAYNTHLKARMEAAARAHDDSEDDKAPVPDCNLCDKPGVGEYHCQECDVDMCEECMDEPPDGHDHDPDEHTCVWIEDAADSD